MLRYALVLLLLLSSNLITYIAAVGYHAKKAELSSERYKNYGPETATTSKEESLSTNTYIDVSNADTVNGPDKSIVTENIRTLHPIYSISSKKE
jgi:hypothetical protein